MAQLVTADPAQLTDELRHRIADIARPLVAVDGIHGAGKTTLAQSLARALGLSAFDADDFLDRNRGAYLAHVRVPQLAQALAEASCGAVLAGVRILDLLDLLGRSPDVLVYVRRVARLGG